MSTEIEPAAEAAVKDTAKDTWLHEQIFLVKKTLQETFADRKKAQRYLIGGLAAVVLLALYITANNNQVVELEDEQHVAKALKVLSKYEGCQVSARPEQTGVHKTIFLPQYPESISDELARDVVRGVTGMATGAKSLYAKSASLNKCVNKNSPTAMCMLIHPLVGTDPESFTDFYHEVIYGIRNPMTTFPAYVNAKAIHYNNVQGQVDANYWKQIREEYLPKMIEEWKDQIRAWKKLPSFKIGMYLEYETLMDHERGPAELSRVATFMAAARYQTATAADMPCIWYQSIGKERLENHQKFRYEFHDYVPAYTKEQQELLLKVRAQSLFCLREHCLSIFLLTSCFLFFAKGVQSLAAESSDDKELVAILKEYENDIQNKIHLEV
jgi:hypothetical protein